VLCVAVCCGVLQCVAVLRHQECRRVQLKPAVLQCVAVCCSVLPCDTERHSMLQCVAACCSVMQCNAV